MNRIAHELTIVTVCVIISSSQTVHPSGLFAAYHTHLVYTNSLCSFGSSQMPHITHILLRWTIFVLLPNRKQFVQVNHMMYITHTLSWLTISVAFPNSTQFIEGKCMSYIAHTLIWLPVLFFCLIANSSNGLIVCPASHKQLKYEPCLMHPPSQTFCTFFDVFTSMFVINASHTVSSKGLWS